MAANGEERAIRTEGLTRRFGDLTAVDSLSVEVSEGEIFGLVGPDGAGKTTTMRLLTAVMDPTSGDAWVAGRHTVREAEAVKDRIGYMSQRFGLYPDLTVQENLSFYADLYGVSGRLRASERLYAFSNLGDFKKRLAGALSGGMKQKLGLMCALIHAPQVLFLDEPTNGVDPVSRRDFWRILYQLVREKVTIFLSTAYLDEAERCARVGLMHRGRLLALGTPGQVKARLRGAMIEIRTDHSRQAAARLREAMGVTVTLLGDRVHVACKDAVACAARARDLLAAADIHVAEVRPIPPSLEDVMVGLIGESEQRAKQSDESDKSDGSDSRKS